MPSWHFWRTFSSKRLLNSKNGYIWSVFALIDRCLSLLHSGMVAHPMTALPWLIPLCAHLNFLVPVTDKGYPNSRLPELPSEASKSTPISKIFNYSLSDMVHSLVCWGLVDCAYLHRVTPAIDAVFRAFWSVARTPVKLHFFCLKPPW